METSSGMPADLADQIRDWYLKEELPHQTEHWNHLARLMRLYGVPITSDWPEVPDKATLDQLIVICKRRSNITVRMATAISAAISRKKFAGIGD